MTAPILPITAPNKALSLSEHAYLLIRERILKGEIPLGGALSRRKLASELGVSLLPVAEALQRLENEGLVESQPRVGTRVCLPTAQDIRDRYEIREALESQAARATSSREIIRRCLAYRSADAGFEDTLVSMRCDDIQIAFNFSNRRTRIAAIA